MTSITKEGVEVRPGQIWKDLDKRMAGRYVKVLRVEFGKAVAQPCLLSGQVCDARKIVRISIARMHKGSTGWAIVP